MKVKDLIDKLQTFHPMADVKATLSEDLPGRTICRYGSMADCNCILDSETMEPTVIVEIEVDRGVSTISYFPQGQR